MVSKSNFVEIFERQELIEKLIDAGFGRIVEAMLNNEKLCFTRSSRLNKSGTCRVLGWKTKQLEDALDACKEILKNDLDDVDETES